MYTVKQWITCALLQGHKSVSFLILAWGGRCVLKDANGSCCYKITHQIAKLTELGFCDFGTHIKICFKNSLLNSKCQRGDRSWVDESWFNLNYFYPSSLINTFSHFIFSMPP